MLRVSAALQWFQVAHEPGVAGPHLGALPDRQPGLAASKSRHALVEAGLDDLWVAAEPLPLRQLVQPTAGRLLNQEMSAMLQLMLGDTCT